jgi:hypothetical protein
VGLYLVFEILFAQQVEPIAADPAQDGVHCAHGKGTIDGIKKRP